MAEPVLCEINLEGEILELGSFRFLVAPRAGEHIAIPGRDHDEIFRVLRVMHSAMESRETGDYIKLVVTRDLGL